MFVASQVKSGSLRPKWPVRGGLLEDRAEEVELLAEGTRAEVETWRTASSILPRLTFSVPNVSTMIDTGCATPMA